MALKMNKSGGVARVQTPARLRRTQRQLSWEIGRIYEEIGSPPEYGWT